jgi:glutathione synthase/RimK-type ligase-like ATP-grasp enzyme
VQIVLNDPDGLSRALNKMYFQDFPEEVRPRTLITRDRAEIKAFAREEGGAIVLKPLAGSRRAQHPGEIREADRSVLHIADLAR